jgi:LAS superfamily LD-carboxypeptidase LdcB
MRPRASGTFAIILSLVVLTATDSIAANKKRANSSASRSSATKRPKRLRSVRRVNKSASSSCLPCEAAARGSRSKPKARRAKVVKTLPCHPKDYLDPKVARNYRSAVREMKRAGITPKVTSVWRSSDYQDQLHKCALSSRCRLRKGVYGAMPSGRSLHEAGLAVDIAGISGGSRGHRYLTPRGHRVVRIMEKHGFKWRYGLADPVHFEADPRKAGYRSVAQAIRHTQSTCQVRLASAKKVRRSPVKAASARRVQPRGSKRTSTTRKRLVAKSTRSGSRHSITRASAP